MEQSLSKIDKIDEETEDEGTCSRVQNDHEYGKDCNNSMVICDQESKNQLSLIESRVTLPQEDSQMTSAGPIANNLHSNNNSLVMIDVSVEQPMQATIKSKVMQSLRKSKDGFPEVMELEKKKFICTSSNNQVSQIMQSTNSNN